EPVTDAIARAHRVCFSCEDQESRLKGVFGVCLVPERPPANAEHHGTVSADECCECRLVAVGQETVQQLTVSGRGRFGPERRLPQVPDDATESACRHRRLRRTLWSITGNCPPRAWIIQAL